MKTYLLDTNLLLALAWPNHVHHAPAHAWMLKVIDRRWATCPLTEAGFLRLSCNPKVVGVTVYPSQALEILERNTRLAQHEFWPDGLSVVEALVPFSGRVVGHQQVTDAYLLGLAIRQKEGVLATFDQRMTALLPEESSHHEALEIIRY